MALALEVTDENCVLGKDEWPPVAVTELTHHG